MAGVEEVEELEYIIFFFNDTATTEIYTLSLHDALPILMLITGAVWAQDAWGRYWAWDSLETSAFLTWIFLEIGRAHV